LAAFWRNNFQSEDKVYDAIVTEERYASFSTTFIAGLQSIFTALDNIEYNRERTAEFSMLLMKRLRLRITIYDSVCWNFRPVLLLQPSDVSGLPPYKRVLITSHIRMLATASLKILDSVATLHYLIDTVHTKCTDIVFYTFEAAVLLISCCTRPQMIESPLQSPSSTTTTSDNLLGLHSMNVTRKMRSEAAHGALTRLRSLAEVSGMAQAGVKVLAELLDRHSAVLSSAREDIAPATLGISP
jgi:hypothetical protein